MQIASSKTKYAAKVQHLSRIAKFLLKKNAIKKETPFRESLFLYN